MLIMRYSRTIVGDDGLPYLITSTVFMAELMKVVVCLVILFFQHGKNLSEHLCKEIVEDWVETMKVSVPAVIYTIQNSLMFVAASNMEAAHLQITMQLKILTTAAFSVLMLNRTLSRFQITSLTILFLGVSIVQISQGGKSSSSTSFLGTVCALIACFLSGFAGVYFEKMLKGYNKSVWLRNIQIGIFSLVLSIVAVFSKDGQKIADHGFFQGYTWATWVSVIILAVGGLLVALVIKFADNILKGFATSLSIILSAVISWFMFDIPLSFLFVCGTFLVLLATLMYSIPPTKQSDYLPLQLNHYIFTEAHTVKTGFEKNKTFV